jgi:hypothetical protein
MERIAKTSVRERACGVAVGGVVENKEGMTAREPRRSMQDKIKTLAHGKSMPSLTTTNVATTIVLASLWATRAGL